MSDNKIRIPKPDELRREARNACLIAGCFLIVWTVVVWYVVKSYMGGAV